VETSVPKPELVQHLRFQPTTIAVVTIPDPILLRRAPTIHLPAVTTALLPAPLRQVAVTRREEAVGEVPVAAAVIPAVVVTPVVAVEDKQMY
jgi:hypothetical protein